MLKKITPVLCLVCFSGYVHSAEIYSHNGNKLDLYSVLDGLHYFSSDSSRDGDMTYMRFGFRGETQISDTLTGYGQWEYNIEENTTETTGSNTWTRLAYAGLNFDNYGSFDYGRNYGVLYDIESWLDVLPEFGGDSYTYADNFMVGRANGVATYRNSDFFGLINGLNFALQYQGKNESKGTDDVGTNNRGNIFDGSDTRYDNGDGYGISMIYEIGGGVSLGAAYSTSDRTNEQVNGRRNNHIQYAEGDTADAWSSGLKYEANNVYLGAMYSETHNMTPYGDAGIANKTQNVEFTAQYQFDSGLRPAISYLQSKGKGIYNINGSAAGDRDLVKYFDIGATYYFNKNMSTYIDYKINLLNGNADFYLSNGISTDNIAALGLVYQF